MVVVKDELNDMWVYTFDNTIIFFYIFKMNWDS